MSWLREIVQACIMSWLEWWDRPRQVRQVGGGIRLRERVNRRIWERVHPQDHYGARTRQSGDGDAGAGPAADKRVGPSE